MVIGTGQLIDLLYSAGWILKKETPCTFRYDTPLPASLEALTTADGTQIWFNPRLG
jgi:hypothetical protein